jgi:hypothetical protein
LAILARVDAVGEGGPWSDPFKIASIEMHAQPNNLAAFEVGLALLEKGGDALFPEKGTDLFFGRCRWNTSCKKLYVGYEIRERLWQS